MPVVHKETLTKTLQELDGTRPDFFDAQVGGAGNQTTVVPPGWVIDGEQTEEPWWKKVNAVAIPLKPQEGFLGLELFQPEAAKKAEQQLQKAKEQLGGEVIMLMVPDEETKTRWFTRPVRTPDLFKKEETLRKEMDEAGAPGKNDIIFFESKRAAYMAVTGYADTK